jgi:hypothetical protein
MCDLAVEDVKAARMIGRSYTPEEFEREWRREQEIGKKLIGETGMRLVELCCG